MLFCVYRNDCTYFFLLFLLIQYIAVIDSWILNQTHISKINATASWSIILSIDCWIHSASVSSEAFYVCIHKEREPEYTHCLVSLLLRELIPSEPSGPHLNPMTSQRPPLQGPSHWGSGRQSMNLGGTVQSI